MIPSSIVVKPYAETITQPYTTITTFCTEHTLENDFEEINIEKMIWSTYKNDKNDLDQKY